MANESRRPSVIASVELGLMTRSFRRYGVCAFVLIVAYMCKRVFSFPGKGQRFAGRVQLGQLSHFTARRSLLAALMRQYPYSGWRTSGTHPEALSEGRSWRVGLPGLARRRERP